MCPRLTQGLCNFYKKAHQLQVDNRLTAGCSGDDFTKRAISFCTKINPNLPQKFEGEDVGTHIIDMMPDTLSADARRITADLKAAGKLGDANAVIKACRAIVAEEAKPGKAAATTMVPTALAMHDLGKLSSVTGMALQVQERQPRRTAGAAGEGAARKWCKGCPHKVMFGPRKGEAIKCICSPDYEGYMPCAIWSDEKSRKDTEELRKKNFTSVGKTYVPLKVPTEERLKQWRDRKAKAKAKGAAGAAEEGATGVALSQDALEDAWYARIEDVELDGTTGVCLAELFDELFDEVAAPCLPHPRGR